MDDEFMTTIWPKLTAFAQAQLQRIFNEYGVGHRDLTEEEIEYGGGEVARIVNEDLAAQKKTKAGRE